MNRAKYIIGVILIIGGFLFTGELFIFHLDNFQTSYYRASFVFGDEIPAGYDNADIVDDFIDAGESFEVDFFTVRNKSTSSLKKRITIYGTEKAIAHLKEHHIIGGIYPSLYAGKTEVSYKAFSDIEDIVSMRQLYLLGTEESIEKMHAFKALLISEYGGGFPHLYGSDRATYSNLNFIWGIIYIVLLLLTVYEVLLKKKEILVRLTCGEDLRSMFFKSILQDTVVFMVIFFMLFGLLRGVSHVQFFIHYTVMLFGMFLFINMSIHAFLFRIELKKDLSNAKSGKNLLMANATIKVITAMVAILLLASNFMMLALGYNYYKQREFFENHSDYEYYWLNYKMFNKLGKTYEDTNLVHQEVYKQFQDKAVQYIDLTGDLSITYPTILINYAAKNELLSSNEKFQFLPSEIDEKIYLFFPDKKIKQETQDIAISICGLLFNSKSSYEHPLYGEFKESFEIQEYSDHIELLGIHDAAHLYRSKLIKNPIIILNNTHQILDARSASHQFYYAYHVLYNLTEEEFNSFVKKHQLEDQIVRRTNALEFYEHNWTIIKRAVKLASSLSVFLLALELILILLILKMEYRMHSVEIALKKVLGYSLFARNRQVLILSLCTSLFSVFAAGIVALVFHLQEGMYVATAGLLVFSIEALYVYYKINTIEKMKIATILKGEGI